jgi:hypothetical protein
LVVIPKCNNTNLAKVPKLVDMPFVLKKKKKKKNHPENKTLDN